MKDVTKFVKAPFWAEASTISLIDFMSMPKKNFWGLVNDIGAKCHTRVTELWEKAKNGSISRAESIECLNCLFVDSHQRIQKYSNKLKTNYPTKQYSKNRLINNQQSGNKAFWWVDHFTAGISHWGTLNWFSGLKRTKKNGKKGYSGASTHFILGYHDLPFYIIPLMHSAWHEPRRNKDSISIEHVNCGKITKGLDDTWHFWAGKIPEKLVQELPPVTLAEPYRGCKVMQPYTKDQIINNIVLKRIVISALDPCLSYERMSQHTDWRSNKSDMGVLWPFRDCNRAAYNSIPIDSLDFIVDYDDFIGVKENTSTEDFSIEDIINEEENPSYGKNTPTHDDDQDDDTSTILTVKEVQQHLTKIGFIVKADDILGPKTRKAIKSFQKKWNAIHETKKLKIDGIPGPNTCAALIALKGN